jgi:hypothetical protein
MLSCISFKGIFLHIFFSQAQARSLVRARGTTLLPKLAEVYRENMLASMASRSQWQGNGGYEIRSAPQWLSQMDGILNGK